MPITNPYLQGNPYLARASAVNALTRQRLSDSEESSIISRALSPPVSALQRIGESFEDTFGGRAVRGVMAGKPQELLSLAPTAIGVGLAPATLGLSIPVGLAGSFLFNLVTGGLGDSEDRTSGRELGKKWTGGDPGFWGGLAVDVLTDPSTFISGGLTKAGSTLSKAGIRADDVAKITGKAMGGRQALATTKFGEVASSPALSALQKSNLESAITKSGLTLDELSGMKLHEGLTFGLPFAQIGAKGSWRSKAVPIDESIAKPIGAALRTQVEMPSLGNVLPSLRAGDIKGAIGALKPTGIRTVPWEEAASQADASIAALRNTGVAAKLNQLFTKASGNRATAAVQQAHEAAVRDFEDSIIQSSAEPVSRAMRDIQQVPEVGTAAGAVKLRDVFELPMAKTDFRRLSEAPAETAIRQAGESARETFRGALDSAMLSAKAAGVGVGEYVPPIPGMEYFPRHMTPVAGTDAIKFPSKTTFSNASRDRLLNLIPRGSKALEQATQDPQIANMAEAWRSAPGELQPQMMEPLERHVRENVQDLVQSRGKGTEAKAGTWSLDRSKWIGNWLEEGWKSDPAIQVMKQKERWRIQHIHDAASKTMAAERAKWAAHIEKQLEPLVQEIEETTAYLIGKEGERLDQLRGTVNLNQARQSLKQQREMVLAPLEEELKQARKALMEQRKKALAPIFDDYKRAKSDSSKAIRGKIAAMRKSYSIEKGNIDFAAKNSAGLAQWISGQHKNLFNHPVMDAATSIDRLNFQAKLADNFVDLLANSAQRMPGVDKVAGHRRLDEVLLDIGGFTENRPLPKGWQAHNRLTDEVAKNFINKASAAGKEISASGLMDEAAMAQQEAAMLSDTPIKQLNEGEILRAELKNWQVPEKIAEDMKKGWSTVLGKEIDLPMKAYRRATGFWKSIFTMTPRFFSRNWLSAGWQNIAALKMFDPTKPWESGRQIMQAYRDARAVLAGKTPNLTDIYPGARLTPEQALAQFKTEVAGTKTIQTPQVYMEIDPLTRTIGSAPSPQQFQFEQMQAAYPGSSPVSYGDIAKGAVAGTKKGVPFKAVKELPAGMKAAYQGKELPPNIGQMVEGAQRLNAQIEGEHRLAAQIFLRRAGIEPVTAGRMVDSAHVSYSKSSNFERTWMRGLIPFYTWPRQMAEEVVRGTLRNPRGPYTQLARVEARASDEDPTLPPHIAGGAAIKVGEDAEGNASYITNLADLPPELFNRFMSFGPGGIRRSIAQMGGNLNPLIKLPFELAFGRTLYDARDIRDKESKIGRMAYTLGLTSHPDEVGSPTAELVASQVPGLSQAVQIGSQALDARKSFLERLLNIGSGVRFSTVSERDRMYAIRNAIEEQLLSAPGVSKYSNIYSADPSMLTENQRLLLELNADQSAKLRDMKKKAKKDAVGR